LERKEIKDILAYVRYLYNPKDSVSLKRIINTPRRSISDDTVKTLEQYAMTHNMSIEEVIDSHEQLMATGLATRAMDAIRKFSTTMNFLKLQLDSLSVSELIEQVIQTIKYQEYLTETEGKQAQEKIDNL